MFILEMFFVILINKNSKVIDSKTEKDVNLHSVSFSFLYTISLFKFNVFTRTAIFL